MKLLVLKLKWKKGKTDVHSVVYNWTLKHPSFEKHILPHEIFEKFLTTEEMERICLESNPASKVVQIRAALVPVPSPDKWGGLRQEGHPA